MPLIDLLPPTQRTWLRRLHKRIANREAMRRYRAEGRTREYLLCSGVDLPIEAGTCGRLVDKRYTRCYRCRARRDWLLNHALNSAEIAVTAMLETDATELEDTAPLDLTGILDDEHDPDHPAPLLDDLGALGDACLRW